jgi:hypothetical protein
MSQSHITPQIAKLLEGKNFVSTKAGLRIIPRNW